MQLPSSKTGLTQAQATANLKKYGRNEIPEKKEYTTLKIFISQFSSFLIIILIISGTIAIFLGETTDGSAIFTIVIINTIIGFIQEYKAENAVKALKKMVVEKTIVLRDGHKKEIPIVELVPEDIIFLSEGAKIPADLEIIESFSLKVDESILTGESVQVEKTATKSSKKENILFKGTIITTGHVTAKVISTGINTEFGKIVYLVSKQEDSESPLSKQLNQLGKKLGLTIIVLIAIIFLVGLLRDIETVQILMTSVSLGVAAIPEGMPIIVTLTLAIGVQTMAQKKAIIRKMNAIETLGATTIICSDKTGTLTLNEMTVKKVYTSFKETTIPGAGYSTKEKIKLTSPEQKKLLEICENCNNSYYEKNGSLGDPTEIALKVLAQKTGYVKPFKKHDEIIFTSERKMMSTLHETEKSKEIFAKGAYEEIIKNCTRIMENGQIKPLTPTHKKHLTITSESYSNKALRVLAFAYKPHKDKFDESDLIFVGLVGMIDPPRKTVPESMKIAQKAGIKIKIITGDNQLTAKAIGKQIGLLNQNVITGDQIDKMKDSELKKVILETGIFARTTPEHKYRIVDLLKKSGEIVAVTGDGVNDAPALKHADVGIAMGIKGTEASKEISDIILKDDNFTTIVNTIEEGRRIYKNIVSFVKYMLSANFDTLAAVGILTLCGLPLPILPLQILWLNIATDGLPALALGQSPANKDIMEESPHPKEERLFKKFLGFIITAAIIQTIANLSLYFYGMEIDMLNGINTADFTIPSHARTMVFTQIVLFELFFVFVCKEEKSLTFQSFFSNKALIGAVGISLLLQIFMIYTPFMQTIFKTTPLDFTEWIIIIAISATAFLVPYATKLLKPAFKK